MRPYNKKASVLVVDDDRLHCHLMEQILRDDYTVRCIHSVPEAISHLGVAGNTPDIILLDLNMPQADGRQLLYAIKAQPQSKNIPIIFVTIEDDPRLQEQTLELGAVDYLLKPVQPGILKRKIANHIRSQTKQNTLHAHNVLLHEELAETINELQLVQDVTVLALATLTEVRNSETGEHIWRTQEYVRVLAQALRNTERFCHRLTDKDVYLIYKTAPLHDIGKVGIPDRILNKPSALSAEEMEVIKSHTLIGHNALSQAEQLYENTESSFLRYAREICCSHHERWDGGGYPHGLAGEQIPLSARIMAIADVYDALISKRAYKAAYGHNEAVGIISEGRGSAFDPFLVDLFLEHHLEFNAIASTSQQLPA
jgi:putative two-component system response regulator